jgi:hypothetical protein
MAEGLWPANVPKASLSFEEKKVCTLLMLGACSAYIVKRRLIWRLPGILAILWVAEMSEPSSDDPCEGLAGLNLVKDWR